MEKAAMNKARLQAMAAAVVLCLLLLATTGPQVAAGAEEGFLSYDKLISCKTLGNCDKGPEATRPGKPVHEYTRGCSKITLCRG